MYPGLKPGYMGLIKQNRLRVILQVNLVALNIRPIIIWSIEHANHLIPCH